MLPGKRFNLNLDDDADFLGGPTIRSGVEGLIKDIVEKKPSSTPITPPLPSRATSSGFPEHRKRAPKQSAFRQQQAGNSKSPYNAASPKLPPVPGDFTSERQKINEENQKLIDAMSPEEIEKERRELIANLSPGLVDRLLKRATVVDKNIDSSGWNAEGSKLSRPMPLPTEECRPSVTQSLQGGVMVGAGGKGDEKETEAEQLTLDERAPRTLPLGQTLEADPIKIPISFPTPPAAPELDPSSPDFLTQLHSKYYPDLPADPGKLSWMAPISKAEDAHYDSSLPSLVPSALRFDFKGNLLPPRKSQELPTHLGLHHHGDAPGAAGYTIPELSHLARSSFPAQRCMAMQTLGRILYRLGVGVYGEDVALNQGLWRCMHEGRVMDGLQEAANGRGTSHMGIKAYAVEALWNWQKGGGQRWKAQ